MTYALKKQKAKERSAAISAAGRDIGAIPPIANPARRAAADRSFRAFCESYFPQKFALKWSADHLKAIERIEATVRQSETFAFAMPRGSGKTTLCGAGTLWAILTGAHRFVMLIGSSAAHSSQMLANLKSDLASNDALLEDYPEVCYPIRCLAGETRRCQGQTHHGARTMIQWGSDDLVMPTIPGSRASGAVIRVAGITGEIRGAVVADPSTGQLLRPTLAILDDPQTDESARSPGQCASRLETINGAVLGLAGPGKQMAAIMPCTVIRQGDLADTLLDREKSPLWNGERSKLVYSFPTDEKLWDEYGKIRADGFKNGDSGEAGNKFYKKNRKAMDKGAVVAWPERFNPNEISAIQNAMNLRIRNEYAFWAEYQNEPKEEDRSESVCDVDQVTAKINGRARGEVPSHADHLTAFIDVQGKLLYWAVVAWSNSFGGDVVDYGAWPDQRRHYFTLREAKRTLLTVKPGAGQEAAIYAGLEALTGEIMSREWKGEDGAPRRIDRCLIDANWGQSTNIVRSFCRQSKHAAQLMPSHGRYVGAASVPFSDHKRKKGERMGEYWRISPIANQRHVQYDTNHWKSFIHARLSVPLGDPGALCLFGNNPTDHRLLADHLTAEAPTKTTGRGREVVEWRIKPGAPDNHWFDCIVGAAVAASIQGATILQKINPPKAAARPATRRKVAYMQ